LTSEIPGFEPSRALSDQRRTAGRTPAKARRGGPEGRDRTSSPGGESLPLRQHEAFSRGWPLAGFEARTPPTSRRKRAHGCARQAAEGRPRRRSQEGGDEVAESFPLRQHFCERRSRDSDR